LSDSDSLTSIKTSLRAFSLAGVSLPRSLSRYCRDPSFRAFSLAASIVTSITISPRLASKTGATLAGKRPCTHCRILA